MLKLLQINFYHFPPDPEIAREMAQQRATAIAQWPGLLWKIWIFNDITSEAGGIYLFQDEASAHAYLSSPIIQGLKQLPGVEDFVAKLFDIAPNLSQLTHAPLRNQANDGLA